jgi:hypothetical protein
LLISVSIPETYGKTRSFVSKEQWSKYAKKYNYNEDYKTKPEKNDKPKEYNRGSSQPFFTGAAFGKMFIVIVGVILVIAIIVIIVGLIKSPVNKSIPKTNESYKNFNYENIENADLETDLNQALSSEEFKYAIRLKYLMVLRLLNEHRLVIWRKEKTNGTYVREMTGKKEYELFRDITIRFERMWYGEIAVTEKEYSRMLPAFDQIQSSINSRE